VADRAEKRARAGGLFLRFWDGSKPSSHGDGAGGFDNGMIQTHAATVSLLAWLGAVKRPPGKPRKLPDAAISHPKWQTWVTVERRQEGGDALCYVQGHIRGWSAKTVPYGLDIAVRDGGATDTRSKPGRAEGGRKTTGVVTILERGVDRVGRGPLDITVTGTVGGKRYVTTRHLDPPWC
jgi:hypothetical protein